MVGVVSMTRQTGIRAIAGLMIVASLWGCGESSPETSAEQGAQTEASADSAMPEENHDGHAEKAHGEGEHDHGDHGHGDHGEHGDHAHGGHDHGDHDHGEPFAIPEGEPVPTVDLAVEPDPVAGWNVQVTAENFRFAPEEVANPGDWNAGHAHLYLDGKKVARLYGPWFHLTGVEPGDRTLRVTLNTNDHRDLKVGEGVVEATTEFTVPES